MQFTSPEGEQRYADLVRAAARSAVGLDFDGVLAPIVADPGAARIHPGAGDVLVGLAREVRAVAVITGRPAEQALALGDLPAVADRMAGDGGTLELFGQYGNERWSSTSREVVSPDPPEGLPGLLDELPATLRGAGVPDAFIEEKRLAVAVHTRRLPDPAAAMGRLTEPLQRLAERHGLALEPGRNVVEVREPGMHKGRAVRTLAREVGAGGFLFAGDDLGDIEAFEAVERLHAEGLPTLLVCVASPEQQALRDLADVVVDGPDGVLELLRRFTADARSGH